MDGKDLAESERTRRKALEQDIEAIRADLDDCCEKRKEDAAALQRLRRELQEARQQQQDEEEVRVGCTLQSLRSALLLPYIVLSGHMRGARVPRVFPEIGAESAICGT